MSATRRLRIDPCMSPTSADRRCQAGADCPDRLIGDDDIRRALEPWGRLSVSWRETTISSLSGLSLIQRLADADDGG